MKVQELMEMAKRMGLADFYAAAKKEYGAAAVKDIKWTDVVALARKLDVTIPAAAHKNKTGRGRVNLTPDGEKDDAPTPAAKPTAKAEPKAEPKPKASKDGVTKAEIMKEVPEVGKETFGDMLDWQVSEYNGKVTVMWDYTYKRMNTVEAFKYNQRRIEAANERLKMLAKKYKHALIKEPIDMTLAGAKKIDQNDGRNGGYSEYEQTLGNSVSFKAAS